MGGPLWVLNEIIKTIYTESLKKIVGVFLFFYYFIRNPQTTIALPFLTHNISAIGGVIGILMEKHVFGSCLCWQNSVYTFCLGSLNF